MGELTEEQKEHARRMETLYSGGVVVWTMDDDDDD